MSLPPASAVGAEPPASCIDAQLFEEVLERAEQAASARPAEEDLDKIGQPMTEPELVELTRLLRSVRSGKGWPSAGVGIGPRRLGVLLGDVVGGLADLHARDLARQFEPASLTLASRKWLDGMLGAMKGCGPERFESRGGRAQYEKSLSLIQKHRSSLEPLVLESTRLLGGSPGRSTGDPGRRP